MDKLISSLRTSYPEDYGKIEKAVFKEEVQKTFKDNALSKVNGWVKSIL